MPRASPENPITFVSHNQANQVHAHPRPLACPLWEDVSVTRHFGRCPSKEDPVASPCGSWKQAHCEFSVDLGLQPQATARAYYRPEGFWKSSLHQHTRLPALAPLALPMGISEGTAGFEVSSLFSVRPRTDPALSTPAVTSCLLSWARELRALPWELPKVWMGVRVTPRNRDSGRVTEAGDKGHGWDGAESPRLKERILSLSAQTLPAAYHHPKESRCQDCWVAGEELEGLQETTWLLWVAKAQEQGRRKGSNRH